MGNLLLSCPFCRSPVDNLPERPFLSGGHWVARCGNPDCGAEILGDSAEEAARRWNTRMGMDYFHLSSGGKDPDEKRYSKRDVEALVAVALAVRKAKEGA